MLRWTIRTIGSHDSNPRLSCFFSPHTLRLSKSRFSCTGPVTDLPGIASSSLTAPSRSSMNTLERRDNGTDTRSADSSINALRWCLSSDNVSSDRPLIYSPTIIRSLYYRAESRNQLGMLDSNMLTLLIGLFGSLSIRPHRSFVYRVPLAPRLSEVSTSRTHWAFLMKVGRYKLERGMTLHDSDRFWLMRAELAIVQARSPLEPLSGNVYNAILRARIHYHVIRRHSHHSDVHAYYLETLLTTRDPRLLDLAARDLSFLLRTHRMCHPWLQRLLYRLVVEHGGSLSTRSQEVILAALWSRICQGIDDTCDIVSESGLSDIALDATTIVRSVSATLFSFTGGLGNDKLANIPDRLFSVFCPAYALPLRWSSLILLSIYNSEAPHFNGTHWTVDHAMPQETSCWQVIFGLATIEKILQGSSSALEMQAAPTREVLETSRTLYRLWLSIIKSCSISRDLACAVATSFLRIASILADATLFYDCQDLYGTKNDSESSQTSIPKLFAAQYIAAAVRVQGPLPYVVLTALEAFSPGLEQQHQVLTSAVEVLAPIDASLAYTLYNIVAQAKGMELDPGVAHTLAMSFARRGALRQAVLFLNDGRSSLEARGILLSAIARSLRENLRVHHPPSVFAAIVDGIVALYQSHVPPEHFQGHLEQLFVVLARYGRGSRLLPVVLSIFKRSPGFFQSHFFDRYYRVLVRRRQFFIASQLLDAITAAHPKLARSLCILKDRIAMQTKASRVLKRIPLRNPASLRLSSCLRRSPHAGPPLERSLQELLNSGRILAARHIFACVATTIPSSRCTALGNILIHGASRQPRPRNGRRVRKILALLENLVKNYGFQPDRVTANILVKVMINWRSVYDSPRLRELFDQLVRSGYPAADYSPLHPPFGTRQMQFSDSSSFSKLTPFVSFEKHSRPLFKMFIKAFYSCNDVEAARKIVGILKVEEYKNAMAKEERSSARSRGRIKKNMTSLDTTTCRALTD